MSSSFGCPFRLTGVGSAYRDSSRFRCSSCNRCVNKSYSVGEKLRADRGVAEAVEFVDTVALNSVSKGFGWVSGISGGLRILEPNRVCMAKFESGGSCQRKVRELTDRSLFAVLMQTQLPQGR